ncbi:MAG TPA: amidohydrolase family protein [Candidatus Acidoferrales bacterium]|nr:amidohydrolase family protein [Candidatus Acidoferrales bacterium]
MFLLNLHTLQKDDHQWIEIRKDKIHAIDALNGSVARNDSIKFGFDNAIAFPGLINSHDHLEFNLFPKLGNRKYNDFVEWGEDIHKTNSGDIEKIKHIPLRTRVRYGIYKNLLNGITTVVHHGNFPIDNNDLIDVYSNYNYLHSVRLERHWKLKLNLTPNLLPFLIHIGEGTNLESYREIEELIHFNFFKRRVIGIHGIMMDERQAEHFEALVWCPASNYFLYGSTPRVEKIKHHTAILFGTDSNVSADWNLWDHLRLARGSSQLDDRELYDALTSTAAKIWNLIGSGSLSPGCKADIVIAEKKSEDFFNSFYALNPGNILMVIKNGKIILFDPTLLTQMESSGEDLSHFSKLAFDDTSKFVRGNSNELISGFEHFG